MISVERAWEIACEHAPVDVLTASREGMRDFDSGWFFPWKMTVPIERTASGVPTNVPIGSKGVMINRRTGAVFPLGSADSVERAIEFYDLGYQSLHFDLVVLSVANVKDTIDALHDIGPSVTEISYEAGTVWRVPRPITRKEIAERLSALPCIFPDVFLYPRLERLLEAELAGHFEFRALARPQK